MKKHYFLIIISLLISLFIYLFYRTEKTVVNEILIYMISFNSFSAIRACITTAFPLNEHIIYSLPEALWVFCITLTSKFLFIRIARREFSLLFAPLLFAIGLELFQLLHLTNGRFDFWDIGLSILFWGIANYFIKSPFRRQNLLPPFSTKSLICILSYLIVYLAHVWK
ncbi:hypothetical protein [Pedobacter frigoris]|uniref:hypothetical protein n=1 Tax=Pedobacter frigoris TaxID=2571272 RepID=UPI00292D4A26|nr:hypothetical protein [Pedobacter frigoris]